MAKPSVPSTHSCERCANRAERRGYLPQTDAAQYLGVTTRTIRSMVADGRLVGYRAGPRLVRYKIADLDAAMQPFGAIAADSRCSPTVSPPGGRKPRASRSGADA